MLPRDVQLNATAPSQKMDVHLVLSNKCVERRSISATTSAAGGGGAGGGGGGGCCCCCCCGFFFLLLGLVLVVALLVLAWLFRKNVFANKYPAASMPVESVENVPGDVDAPVLASTNVGTHPSTWRGSFSLSVRSDTTTLAAASSIVMKPIAAATHSATKPTLVASVEAIDV